MDTLGMGKGVRMYKPTRYGETLFGNAATVPSQLFGGLKDYVGAADMTVQHAAPRAKHTVMNPAASPGGIAESKAYYVMRWLNTSPWGAEWVVDGADFFTAYRFPFGKEGGTVQYLNYPLYANYNNGGSNGKKLAEYHVNGLLTRGGILSEDVPVSGDRRGHFAGYSEYAASKDGDRYTPGRGLRTFSGSPLGRVLHVECAASRDLQLWKIDGDLVLNIEGMDGGLSIPGWYSQGRRLASIRLDDGTELSASAMEALASEREPDIDVTPIKTSNRIIPKSGDTHIYGTSGNDLILGTPGYTIYHGNGGSDIYYYRMGDGNDTIMNERTLGARSALRLHSDIVSGDVRVSRRGEDLRLDIGNGSVTVKGWYAKESARLNRVELFDGTVWDARDLEKLADGKQLSPRRQTLDLSLLEGEAPRTESKNGSGESSGEGCNTSATAGSLQLILVSIIALRREKTAV